MCKENAEDIYHRTKAMIKEKHMTPGWCMEVSNVEVVCTTEDPVDTLSYHFKMLEDDSIQIRILSAFRPDKAFYCEKAVFKTYIPVLSAVSGIHITDFDTMLQALEERLLYFKKLGTMISDNGIEDFCWPGFTQEELNAIFAKALDGSKLTSVEIAKYRSGFLVRMASFIKSTDMSCNCILVLIK